MKSLDNSLLPIEDIFQTSNRFSSLDEDAFYENLNEKEITQLDDDSLIRNRALENTEKDTKIARERLSYNPDEYRLFELNTGDVINVPIEEDRRVLRSTKRNASGQTTLNFPIVKRPRVRPKTVKSTPTKSSVNWDIYK